MSVKTRPTFHREAQAPTMERHDWMEPAAEEPQPVRAGSFGRSVRFAWDGISHAIGTQRNFRIQLVCGTLAVIAGAACHISAMEWVMVMAMTALVLSLELLNSALEAVVDMVTMDYHPLAKVAKDSAAAAVLVASTFAVVIAAIIFMPYAVGLMRH